MRPPLETLPDSPDLFRAYRYLSEHPDVQRRPGGWLYKDGFYPDHLTVGAAAPAVFREAGHYCQGEGLDVGAGFWPFPNAIPVDAGRGPGFGRKLPDIEDSSCDFVFSSHCLEHIENWREAVREWLSKIRPGGVLFLYLPHPECAIWQPGSPFVGDGHKWAPSPPIIKKALEGFDCEIVGNDDGPDGMQSFYVCARKVSDGL